MAAGCSGGDWDAVARGWTIQRYEAMRRHWLELAPPAYVSLAASIGFKPPPKAPSADEGQPSVQTPEEVQAFLASIGFTNGAGQ